MPASAVLIFKKIDELKRFISDVKSQLQTVGFVPTMGALHQGHLSLIEESKKNCEITICSIFVNPTQFNDQKDLLRYPKTPEKDLLLLDSCGCDAVFMPEADEMYPEKDTRKFDFGYLDTILEGAHRPGHFNGVAQIVSKLFEAVEPHKAFFGSKDYQQVMIVKALVEQLGLPVEIIACPIVRESDGLAMSSRNMLLGAEEREAAKLIPVLMQEIKNKKASGWNITDLKKYVSEKLSENVIYKLDYFEICNANNLEEISESRQSTAIALIACYVGKIRLIDNIMLD